jgi:crossover junction endodeoxyribonuclease RuvC
VRVLGIDPGTRKLGWGVIDREGSRHTHVAHGVITVDEELPLAERLVVIFNELTEVVEQYAPNAASVEAIFFAKDAQAAAKLGHARGVALLCCARVSVAVFEYPPARVKATVTGSGKADKRTVALMMQRILKLDAPPPADAADALAIALTHLAGPNSRATPKAGKSSLAEAIAKATRAAAEKAGKRRDSRTR